MAESCQFSLEKIVNKTLATISFSLWEKEGPFLTYRFSWFEVQIESSPFYGPWQPVPFQLVSITQIFCDTWSCTAHSKGNKISNPPILSSSSSRRQKNERKITPRLNLVNRFKLGVNFCSFFCPRLEDELKMGVFSKHSYLYAVLSKV